MSNTAVKSQEASDAYDKAWDLFQKENYKGAKAAFQELVTNDPTAQSYIGLGRVYEAEANITDAVKSYIEAIKIDKAATQAYARMGDIYADLKQTTPAIENYAQAIASDPSNIEYKSKLISIVSTMRFKKINPNLKGVLMECLETPGVELSTFGQTWKTIIYSNKVFASYYIMAKSKTYAAFKKSYSTAKSLDALADPFFLTGLGSFVIPEPMFEKFCTYLRRYLLESHNEGKTLFIEPEYAEFIPCALGRYCFLTEYIMQEDESETPLVEALQKKLESSDKPALSELGLYSCYRPLYTLSNAQKIAAQLKGGKHVSQIPKSMIEDYFQQQEFKKTIEGLFEIKDETSLAVQEQYEEFPYPRWTSINKNPQPVLFEERLKGKKAKILIAGCGTGREALQLGITFPDAEILAVDLSKTSIGYALLKQKEFGIHNVEFRQADIMSLGNLDQKFDFIASSGVLHHLKDPVAGWRIINGLLKPGGLMRIALYSRMARRVIIKAREIIAEKKIGSDAQSIKDFRDNINQYLKPKDVKFFNLALDYFSLSECRDLLFHVQEHQFDPDQIKDILSDLDLNFLGLFVGDETKEKFAKIYPDDPEGKDLSNWTKFEEKHPDLFIGMYRFWCEKQA
ncbi:MAG: methyltransferase domain-containing protein [Alphaproteobacteria bacterium]|nr:methyltransferase domain-containing protein [Alphaproteobacteria bacterium]